MAARRTCPEMGHLFKSGMPSPVSLAVDPTALDPVVSSLRTLLPTDTTPWPGGYPGQVELAVIDAVLSVRARYGQPHNGVRGQVALWRAHRGGVADDLAMLTVDGLGRVLTSRQRLSGRSKVEVIADAAGALTRAQITSAGDVLAERDRARQVYCSVKGLSTVTFDYLCMLIGAETVKPDTWILRYLHQVLERPVDVAEASLLLNAAARELGRSAREVDHQVWLAMRSGRAVGVAS